MQLPPFPTTVVQLLFSRETRDFVSLPWKMHPHPTPEVHTYIDAQLCPSIPFRSAEAPRARQRSPAPASRPPSAVGFDTAPLPRRFFCHRIVTTTTQAQKKNGSDVCALVCLCMYVSIFTDGWMDVYCKGNVTTLRKNNQTAESELIDQQPGEHTRESCFIRNKLFLRLPPRLQTRRFSSTNVSRLMRLEDGCHEITNN